MICSSVTWLTGPYFGLFVIQFVDTITNAKLKVSFPNRKIEKINFGTSVNILHYIAYDNATLYTV